MTHKTWIDECRTWCRQVKYLAEEVEWSEKPSHSGWKEATSLLLDERRVTIPHLYFKGEYQAGRAGDRVTYALMFKDGKERRRVFMLEVWPQHVRSHKYKDGTPLFGPHIHFGDYRLQEITRQVRAAITGISEQAWVDRFVRHARINSERAAIEPPFGRDLFGK